MVSVQGVCVHGGLCVSVQGGGVSVKENPPPSQKYASYWNAFLLDVKFKPCHGFSRSFGTKFKVRRKIISNDVFVEKYL